MKEKFINIFKKIDEEFDEFAGMGALGFIIIWIIFDFKTACQAIFLIGMQIFCLAAILGKNEKITAYYCIVSIGTILWFAMAYWY